MDSCVHPLVPPDYPLARLLAKIEFPAEPGGCWLWLSARTAAGYAVVYWRGRLWYVHRLLLVIERGEDPSLQCHHLCRVRSCVNPLHCVAIKGSNHGRLSSLTRWHGAAT